MAARTHEGTHEDEADLGVERAELEDAGARPATPRERRRTRTMRTIQGEALALFARKGYDQTTVEDIADAADISPRTFFRYFPTKEDAVLWDEYDAVIWELLDQRPDDEPPGETMQAITRQAIEGLYRRDPERLLTRNRLLFSVPAVRARFLDFARAGVEVLTTGFAARRGLGPEDELKLQMTATAIVDAAGAAFDRWQRADGKADLLALLDEATDALIAGVAELRPSSRRR
jgi:AcrR family transcriptional regulator